MRQLALIPLLLILVSCSRSPGAVGLGGGTGDPGVRTTSNNSTAIERDLKRNDEIEAGIDKRADALDQAVDFDTDKDTVSDQDDKASDTPSEKDIAREKEIDDLLDQVNSDDSADDAKNSSSSSF
jgi:hypothetical protein